MLNLAVFSQYILLFDESVAILDDGSDIALRHEYFPAIQTRIRWVVSEKYFTNARDKLMHKLLLTHP